MFLGNKETISEEYTSYLSAFELLLKCKRGVLWRWRITVLSL